MSYYVYILRSKTDPKQIYIGYTACLERRMQEHAEPKPTAYTRQYAPWCLETYLVFKSKELAQKSEIYFKSHSGRSFIRKHLIEGSV